MGVWGEIYRRVRYLGRQSRFDRELNDEVRFHLETRAAELEESGLSHRAALKQARREFGSESRMREDSRSAWQFQWLEDLAGDLRYAARSFRRNPAFALTIIACLALGIGANTTIFSLSTELLLSEPSSRQPERLAQFWIGGGSVAPMREYRFIRDANVFEGVGGENEETQVNWRLGETSSRLSTVRVTDNFFSVVGIPVALGRPIRPGDSDVVVLTYGFWQRGLGGAADVVGRKMVLDSQPYTVIGVLPANHRTVTGFGFAPDLYLPVADDKTDVTLYARLPQGMTLQIARARLVATCQELDRLYPHQGAQHWADWAKVYAISGVDRLSGDEVLPIAAFFAMLLIVVWLVLLIACANVASMLLSRAASRSHEFAIRLSIGAGRGRIVRQLLAESFLLSLCGAGAGLALNLGLTSFLNRFQLALPIPIHLVIEPDWRLLIYCIVVVFACTFAAGLMPALKSTRAGITTLLKQGEKQVGRSRWTLRNALVVGQLTISIVLLTAGFLFMRNLLRASTMNPGFDIEHTVWANMRLVPDAYPKPEKTHDLVMAALEELRTLPGIEAAAVAHVVPLNGHLTTGTTMRADGRSDGAHVTFNENYVSADYFKAMQIPIMQGREFTPADRIGSPRVAILNENLAHRLFGDQISVGHTVQFGGGPPIMIVGVARNSKYFTLGEADPLAYYEPYAQRREVEPELQFLIRASGSPAPQVAAINRTLARLDSTAALDIKPMSQALVFALLPSRVGAAILGAIGLLGLALAAVGLYGVLSYNVSGRTREIGLRMALGATRRRILRLVLRQSFALVGIGLGIGLSLAFFAVRPLAAFLSSEVRPTEAINFIVVGFVLCLVALVATISPALRAMRVDPGIALRHD